MKYNNFDNFKHWYNNFQYWFAHVCAFNMVAMNLGLWKFHHLFHDWYKPWLTFFMSYDKVNNFHIRHSNHHLMYYNLTGKCNWDDLIIDWECSQYTKEYGKLNAFDFLQKMFREHKVNQYTYCIILERLKELGLDPNFKDHSIIGNLAWNVIRCRHPKISKKFFLPRQELLSSYVLTQSKDPEGILLGLHLVLTSPMYNHYAHNSYIQPAQDFWPLCFNNRGYIYITKLVDHMISEIKNGKIPSRFGWVLLHTR
jgi:hypothetical protein